MQLVASNVPYYFVDDQILKSFYILQVYKIHKSSDASSFKCSYFYWNYFNFLSIPSDHKFFSLHHQIQIITKTHQNVTCYSTASPTQGQSNQHFVLEAYTRCTIGKRARSTPQTEALATDIWLDMHFQHCGWIQITHLKHHQKRENFITKLYYTSYMHNTCSIVQLIQFAEK